MKRILVATDGSPSSAEAVRFGVELATESGAELIFAHVIPTYDVTPIAGFGAGAALPHEVDEDDLAILQDAAAVAAEHDVVATTILLRGHVVGQLVAYADSHEVDLVVVGSRGRGAVASALLGSVSRGILRECRRSVLVVRSVEVAARTATPA